MAATCRHHRRRSRAGRPRVRRFLPVRGGRGRYGAGRSPARRRQGLPSAATAPRAIAPSEAAPTAVAPDAVAPAATASWRVFFSARLVISRPKDPFCRGGDLSAERGRPRASSGRGDGHRRGRSQPVAIRASIRRWTFRASSPVTFGSPPLADRRNEVRHDGAMVVVGKGHRIGSGAAGAPGRARPSRGGRPATGREARCRGGARCLSRRSGRSPRGSRETPPWSPPT